MPYSSFSKFCYTNLRDFRACLFPNRQTFKFLRLTKIMMFKNVPGISLIVFKEHSDYSTLVQFIAAKLCGKAGEGSPQLLAAAGAVSP